LVLNTYGNISTQKMILLGGREIGTSKQPNEPSHAHIAKPWRQTNLPPRTKSSVE